ncbi:hypothetical protein LCGC14_3147540, partial [marine sediment metagenome]
MELSTWRAALPEQGVVQIYGFQGMGKSGTAWYLAEL